MQRTVALSFGGDPAAEAILEGLHESGLAPDSLVLLDADGEGGSRRAYGDTHLKVLPRDQVDLANCALLLMSSANTELERHALEQGCLVTGHELEGDDRPLYIGAGATPDIAWSVTRLRLAGPELSCLLPVLLGLEQVRPLVRVGATLIKSAEFRGRAGIDELAGQTISLLNGRDATARVFPRQIAFNLLPEANDERLAAELGQMLENSVPVIELQTVTAPLFHGLVAGLQLEFDGAVSLAECRARLEALDGVSLKSLPISPISDCNQSFSCVISQVRQTPEQPASLQFWMIMDPLRFGLAKNCGKVTEFLLNSFL